MNFIQRFWSKYKKKKFLKGIIFKFQTNIWTQELNQEIYWNEIQNLKKDKKNKAKLLEERQKNLKLEKEKNKINMNKLSANLRKNSEIEAEIKRIDQMIQLQEEQIKLSVVEISKKSRTIDLIEEYIKRI